MVAGPYWNFSGSRKLRSDHSSSVLFWSGVPVNSRMSEKV